MTINSNDFTGNSPKHGDEFGYLQTDQFFSKVLTERNSETPVPLRDISERPTILGVLSAVDCGL